MLPLYLLALLSCSLSFVWTATPYKECESKFGNIQAFEVTGCSVGPCIFIKGNTYAMNLTFQSSAASQSAKVSIHGVIAGVPVPFPLPDPDGCKLGIQCPIKENDVNTATLALPVLTSYPSLSLYVKIEITSDDTDQDYACLRFPARITTNVNQRKDFVGWKKGHLFSMLN